MMLLLLFWCHWEGDNICLALTYYRRLNGLISSFTLTQAKPFPEPFLSLSFVLNIAL